MSDHESPALPPEVIASQAIPVERADRGRGEKLYMHDILELIAGGGYEMQDASRNDLSHLMGHSSDKLDQWVNQAAIGIAENQQEITRWDGRTENEYVRKTHAEPIQNSVNVAKEMALFALAYKTRLERGASTTFDLKDIMGFFNDINARIALAKRGELHIDNKAQ